MHLLSWASATCDANTPQLKFCVQVMAEAEEPLLTPRPLPCHPPAPSRQVQMKRLKTQNRSLSTENKKFKADTERVLQQLAEQEEWKKKSGKAKAPPGAPRAKGKPPLGGACRAGGMTSFSGGK